MYLSAYHFKGHPETLLAAHDRLVTEYVTGPYELHICVRGTDGIVVLDACPSREVFEEFHASPGFRAALAAVGLPLPTIEQFGDVHTMALSSHAPAKP